ncbi:MAG: barstar family protein [Anaeroplasmataceae bacterium]|nr:barstar family protein [Anaeroplasmataceae bacterium]MDE6414715.1 barstar family protein [Anaeroplasmataceae bacterium]
MKKIEIDFKNYPTKQKLFTFLMSQIEGLFGANYDALIDALSFYQTPLVLQLIHLSFYEEQAQLLEVLQIIQKENHLIQIN